VGRPKLINPDEKVRLNFELARKGPRAIAEITGSNRGGVFDRSHSTRLGSLRYRRRAHDRGRNGLPPALKSSAEFCKLWVRIYAGTNAWSNVELMCMTLSKHAPDDPFTVRHAAEAQHRQQHSGEALMVLKRGEKSFIKGKARGEFCYAMARYACGMGSMTLACAVLGRAVDDDPSLKMKALSDPDLEKVWIDVQEG
jgi:hypothetical protein